MPDKKLTDIQIKNSLQSYIVDIGCANCGFEDKYLLKVITSALNLINRQDEEINRLQAENKRLSTLAELGNTRANDYRVMRDRALKAEAENERLYKTINNMAVGIGKINHKLPQMKAEAYKEFAERLKEITITKTFSYVTDCSIQEHETGWLEIQKDKLDNLLKELVGEDNE